MKFYGQFKPPQDQLLYEAYFSSGEFGVFMECGAFDGIYESSCRFFEESLGWTGVNIEPVPMFFEQLRINRPQCYNLHAALSDHAGEGDFSHVVHPHFGAWCTNGSLAHSEAHHQDLVAQGCQFTTYKVPLMTFREVIEKSGIFRLDLFVLDVEGHELQVIDGMVGASVLPRVFCVEHGFVDAQQLDGKLAAMGYRKDRIVHNNLVYLRDSWSL